MLTILLVLIVVGILVVMARRKACPGPPRLPLIGSVPWLNLKRGVNDWVLHPLVTKNKVSYIQIGPKSCFYVINDYQMVKELFSKDIFSHRGVSEFAKQHRFVEYSQGAGIILNNGDAWSTQRRFGIRTLRDFGFGKQSLEVSMNNEIDDMIEMYSKSKGDVKISTDFNLPIINILWQLVSGNRILPEDREGNRMVELVNDLFLTGPIMIHTLPFFILKNFPNLTGYKGRSSIVEEHKAYILKIIKQHEETFDPEHLRDFVDVYLLQMKDSKEFTKGDLCTTMVDFFQAGTETTSTTLKWTLLLLTLNQDHQEKCRQELRNVVGDSRPEVAHMSQLPFTMATLAEIQRISCVAPTSLQHKSTQEFTYQGFTFPKGSVLLANLSFIMKDPQYFEDPHTFNPYRFIDSQGNFIKNERVIPFGVGKRFCMGELLARNEIFLFTANFLQRLRFLPPAEHPAPNPGDYTTNLTNIPTDFYIQIQPVT